LEAQTTKRLRGKEPNMLIIGCDYHPGFQQIAVVDTDTGEAGEWRFAHREQAVPLNEGLRRKKALWRTAGRKETGGAPLRTLASLAILVLITNGSPAQNGDAHSGQVVKSSPTLVIVPTSVRSRYGELIRGLDADRFRLADNGQEQNVSLEHVENEALAVVVLIQTGGVAPNELGNYSKLDTIVGSILGASPSKLALVSFDSRVRQIWGFPARADGLDYALTHQTSGDSGAAIRDAVMCGINLLQNQPIQFRRIILLLSQEKDSGSKSSFADVLREVARSGTTIYSFAFPPGSDSRESHKNKPPSKATAGELAAQSGGEAVQFNGEDELEQAMSIAREDIRGGYILSFRPTSLTPGLHTITVQIVQQKGRLKVLARKNYWVD
jgi:VWFA-related protein